MSSLFDRREAPRRSEPSSDRPAMSVVVFVVVVAILWVSAFVAFILWVNEPASANSEVRVVVRDCCSSVAWVDGRMFTLDGDRSFYILPSMVPAARAAGYFICGRYGCENENDRIDGKHYAPGYGPSK